MSYVCAELQQVNNVMTCTRWTVQDYNSGYKLTNEQMSEYILLMAGLFATVAVFKLIKRSFF